jgi:hypothetical protein
MLQESDPISTLFLLEFSIQSIIMSSYDLIDVDQHVNSYTFRLTLISLLYLAIKAY